MKFSTRVPTQWSSVTKYVISDAVLEPSCRTGYANGSSTTYYDTMLFVTDSTDLNEHVEKLRDWIIFHSFISNFSFLAYFFDRHLLQHGEYIEPSQLEKQEDNRFGIDYDDNLKRLIYSPTGEEIDGKTYAGLYLSYKQLSLKDKRLLICFLDQVDLQQRIIDKFTIFNRSYWYLLAFIAILETIFDHSENCKNAFTCTDDDCAKKGLQLQHRIISEKIWIEKVLNTIDATLLKKATQKLFNGRWN